LQNEVQPEVGAPQGVGTEDSLWGQLVPWQILLQNAMEKSGPSIASESRGPGLIEENGFAVVAAGDARYQTPANSD
jgi:hypothetical protein